MLSMQKQLTKPFYVLMALPATAMGFALSVQIATLSWILSERYGLDIKEIGLVWAAGPISGILGQVIVGLISDKVWFWGGRRRPFILIGGVLTALSLVALPNIGLISQQLPFMTILGVAITVALVLDLSINVSFNPTRSIISDLTPEGEDRTRGYTWMQTVSGTFGVLAYAIGALMGKEFLIYSGAVLVLAFTIIPAILMEEPRELPRSDESESSDGAGFGKLLLATLPLWALFAYNLYGLGKETLTRMGVLAVKTAEDGSAVGFSLSPFEWVCLVATIALMVYVLFLKRADPARGRDDLTEFQKIMAAHAFSWVGIQAVFVFLYPYLEASLPGTEGNTLGSMTSISFLVFNAVAAILPAFVLKPLATRMPRVRLHAACLGVMAIAYAAMFASAQAGVLAQNPLLLYVLIGVAGVGWAAVVSLPFAIMSQRIDQTRMGLFMGTFNLSVVLPQLLVSLAIAGYLNAVEDKSMLFAIAMVSLILSALAWLRVKPLGREDALIP